MIKVFYTCGWGDKDSWYKRYYADGSLRARYKIKNLGDKTIKYVYIYFVGYNKVGDEIQPLSWDKYEKVTGPIAKNQTTSEMITEYFHDDSVNNYIETIKISKAVVEYMDGTNEVFLGNQIITDKLHIGWCYVATCIYGSYECASVWTLRRYRDKVLSKTQLGQLFIKMYYTISPFFVKLFGNTHWFQCFFRFILDNIVDKLQKNGFESTPYDDEESY